MLEQSSPLPEITSLTEDAAGAKEPDGGSGERMTRYAMEVAIDALQRTA